MSTLRGQRGYSLTELMVATSLFMAVMLATLALLDEFRQNAHRTEQQNAAQDESRNLVDLLTTDLRNARTIELANANEIVVTLVDPLPPPGGSLNASNVMRVRYCLSGTTLVRQTHKWTTAAVPATPSTATCPSMTTWSFPANQVARNVRNLAQPCAPVAAAAPCPLFTYDSATLAQIRGITLAVVIDADLAKRPLPARLTTTVAIRNQVDGS